jgi:hypothetical protein
MIRSRGKRPRNGSSTPLLFKDGNDGAFEGAPSLVLTTNFDVAPLLARGCLLSEEQDLARPAESDGATGFIAGRSPLSGHQVSRVMRAARNVIPIAIELRPTRQVRRVGVAGREITTEAICLADVQRLLFRSEKEMARFAGLEFGNYSLQSTGLELKADPPSFGNEAAVPEGSAAQLLAESDVSGEQDAATPRFTDELAQTIRRADCVAGALAYLMTGSPGRRSWMSGVQAVCSGKHQWVNGASSWPQKTFAALLGDVGEIMDADRALLTALVATIFPMPVEEGWAPDRVLAETRRLALEYASEKHFRELAAWADRAAEVLAARSEPQSLSDDGHIVPRAVLLVLLRGDLENIISGCAVGPHRPGVQVLGIASTLAAFRAGARALPSRFKAGPPGQGSERLLEYLGELFLALVQHGSNAVFPASIHRPTVRYRHIQPLQGEWVISVARKELARIAATFAPGLDRVFSMGRDLGYTFEEHGDSGLATTITHPAGSKRPVYVKVLSGRLGRGVVVRFSSPAAMLIGKSRARLPKDLLLDLLRRNAEPDVNCRFAIENEGLIVVLVDQLLETLDESEFKRHIQHVAEVAEAFELDRVNVPTVS